MMASLQGMQAFLWISQSICLIKSSGNCFSISCDIVVVVVCLFFYVFYFYLFFFFFFLSSVFLHAFLFICYCFFCLFVCLSAVVVFFSSFSLVLIILVYDTFYSKTSECINNAISIIQIENLNCKGLRQRGLITNQGNFKSGAGLWISH